MSRDKAANVPPSLTNTLSLICVSVPLISPCCFSFVVISLLISVLFLSSLSHPLCHAVSLLLYLCCLFLSPAVSLSGLGVGLGDSVLWILPWLRPKLLGPHGAAAPPGPLPAHPFLFSSLFPWHLNFSQCQLLLLQTFSPQCVSFSLYM